MSRRWRAGRLRADEERLPEESRAPKEGEPLPAGLRTRAERSLGVPLSTVRMHRDADAAAIARAHQARALTHGRHIVAGPEADERSIAHELVHVAQNLRGDPRSRGLSQGGDPSEREARALAPSVRSGRPTGGARAPPGGAIQRDHVVDTSPPVTRRRISRSDLAGFGPAAPNWEGQFDPLVLAPDPHVDELKKNYAERQRINPNLPDLTGIDLAQAWASDVSVFEKSEARRYKIDLLLEKMIENLPREIWLPNADVIEQSSGEKHSLVVTGASGPYASEPLRNKLYTMLRFFRDQSLETDATGLIWDDKLGEYPMVDPASESERYWRQFEGPEPFQVNVEPFTLLEDRALRLYFEEEMEEWSRRAIAVRESVEREKERRGGLVAGGAAGAAIKFWGYAMLGSAAIGSGAALLAGPGLSLWGAGSTAVSNFSLRAALQYAPRVTQWALANPHYALALGFTGLNVAHDIGAGEFSIWNLPFYFFGAYSGRQADRGGVGGGTAPAPPTTQRPAAPATVRPPAPVTAPPTTTAQAPPIQAPAVAAPTAVTTSVPSAAPRGGPIATQPWFATRAREILVSLRLGLANAIPATGGTGGGSPPVKAPAAMISTGGGGRSLQAPLVDPDVAPIPSTQRVQAPTPTTAQAPTPTTVQTPTTPVQTSTTTTPVQTPTPVTTVAPTTTGTPAIAAPQVAPNVPVVAPQPTVAPATTVPQTNVEGEAGIPRDQRAWLKELFGGDLTSGLRAVLGQIWTNTARPGDAGILARWNARYLFNLHRLRFWRAVRRDPDARVLIEAAGGRLEGGATSAPVIVLPDGTRLQITIDHIIERRTDPSRALDPSNLRLSTRRENTVVLRLYNVIDPFITPPPSWIPPNWDEPDPGDMPWDWDWDW